MKFTKYFFLPDQTSPFETGLLDCGHELIRTTDYRLDGMRRGPNVIYVWQYTLSGRGAIQLNGVVHPLPPGSAFFVRIPHEHIYYLPEDSASWEFIFVTLYGKEIERLGNEIIQRFGNVLTHNPLSRTVSLAKRIFGESNGEIDVEHLILYAYEFMETLYREQQSHSNSAPFLALREKVNIYLQEHLSEPIDICTLARVCGYSRSHFIRLFHAASGMTPQKYLQKIRMHSAIRLLQTERKSIKETAIAAGFDDPSYFSRVFRQQYGMTPKEFRTGKIKK